MAIPSFNSFELNDSTYITETVEHRTRATRRMESESISRRMGKALLNTQIQEKVIQLSGKILSDTPTGLQTAVDNLHKNVSGVEGSLIIESGRTYRATAERIRVPDQKYNQTLTDFDIQFVCVQPFSEGSNLVAYFVIPSGTNSKQIDTTISGSAPNRPIFRFVLPSGNGSTPVFRLDIQYAGTANQVTVSGSYQVGDQVVFNYDRYLITVNGSNSDFTGQMDEVSAGDATFVLTVSGRNDGIRGSMEYSPRYY